MITIIGRSMKIIFSLILMLLSTLSFSRDISKKDLSCLVRNAYYEANLEGSKGIALVTKTVLNRAIKQNKSFCSVIYQKYQYSWTRKKNLSVIPANRKLEIEKVVLSVYHNKYYFGTYNNVISFHEKSLKPKWSSKLTKVGTWKNHTFYKEFKNENNVYSFNAYK